MAEVAWLRERLERAEEERAELRRMLALEQQTVAVLRGLPAPRTEDALEVATATHPGSQTEEARRALHREVHELQRSWPWWWLPGGGRGGER